MTKYLHQYLLFLLVIFFSINAEAANLTVSSKSDSGPGSLRNTIANATSGDSIFISNSLVNDSIVLTSGEIVINKNISIVGPGADKFVISGNNNSQIFNVQAGNILYLKGLTLRNATTPSGKYKGGAIYNEGELFIHYSEIYYSEADSFGGAICNYFGKVEITYSTIHHNKSDIDGGGIANIGGFISLFNTTLSNNHAKKRGGGILTTSVNPTQTDLYLDFCTVAENTSIEEGGGIITTFINYQDTSRTFIKNSIVAKNISQKWGHDFYRGLSSRCKIESQGFNIVGNADSSGFLGSTGDIIGNTSSVIDPLIGPLGYYGGTTKTHNLLCGSLALDGGDHLSTVVLDQRNLPRPFFGRVDVGAFESQIDLYPPVVYLGLDVDTCIGTSFSFNQGGPNDSVNWYKNSKQVVQNNHAYSFTMSFVDTIVVEAFSPNKCPGYDTAIYIYKDIKKPKFQNCPSNISKNTSSGNCRIPASWTPPTASDDCMIDTIISSHKPNDTFNAGITIVSYWVYDMAGNYDSCGFTVTVKDNIKPTISCRNDTTIYVDTNKCTVFFTYDSLIGVDNCGDATVKLASGIGSGNEFPIGVNEEVWVVTDAAKNSDTCRFNVIIVDTIKPKITCPGNITTNNDSGKCGATVTYLPPTFTDNCSSSSLKLVEGIGSGGFFPAGNNIEKYIVEDPSGNKDSCSFLIVVEDKEAPEITCPGDVQTCDTIVSYPDPTYSDNCQLMAMNLTEGFSSGSTFPYGKTKVSFEAIDMEGNKNQCSFNVSVYPKPLLNIVKDTTIYYGDTVILGINNHDSNSYTWTPIDFLDDASSPNPAANPEETTTYSVLSTTPFGCSKSDSVEVTVIFELVIPYRIYS